MEDELFASRSVFLVGLSWCVKVSVAGCGVFRDPATDMCSRFLSHFFLVLVKI
jgi:hypothetical protein